MPGLPEASANYMLVSGVTGSVLLSAIIASKTKEAPARLAPWWPISKEQHCPHIGLPCAWHKAFIIKPTAQQLISREVPRGLRTVWHASGSTRCNCTVHMLALYQDYCVCAKKISPSGRLTYWVVLNTWSHPSKVSNKRSHYQTIQLLYLRPVCPWMALHCAWAQKPHLQVQVLFSQTGARNDSMDRRTCGTEFGMNLPRWSTCCMRPFVAHLSPATGCVWWPGETFHMIKLWLFFLLYVVLKNVQKLICFSVASISITSKVLKS